jgi:hypothetical protein
MPEGLSPIEAGKQLHEHNQAPPEPAPPTGSDRHARIVQIGEALLLSLVTIAAAWSGYAAAKWGTESRIELARSATLRNLASRADLAALSTRNFDSSTFNAWFTAYTLNDPRSRPSPSGASGPSSGRLRRLDGHRPAPQPAGPAWTHLPARVPAGRPGQGRALDREAEAASAAGDHAAVVGDEYIRITVFLAAVLFLVGIGSTFKLPTVRYVLICVGAVLLILATVLIARQPGIPA